MTVNEDTRLKRVEGNFGNPRRGWHVWMFEVTADSHAEAVAIIKEHYPHFPYQTSVSPNPLPNGAYLATVEYDSGD